MSERDAHTDPRPGDRFGIWAAGYQVECIKVAEGRVRVRVEFRASAYAEERWVSIAEWGAVTRDITRARVYR